MKRTLSSKEVISMLSKQGWILQKRRGKGSHTVMKSADGMTVTIPLSKEQPIGTQKNIESTTGLKLQ